MSDSATPSLGFSRQEHWSGLPFPSPVHKSEKWKWSCSVLAGLFATPWTAAYQAPLSMGFSRQEYWSGGAIAFSVLVAQLCWNVCDHMDYSPPGSCVHGNLQARILEWVAFLFSRGPFQPDIEPMSPALQAEFFF